MDNATVEAPNTEPQARARNAPDTVGPPAERLAPLPEPGATRDAADPLPPTRSAKEASSTFASAAAEPRKSEPGAQDSTFRVDDVRPCDAAGITLPSLILHRPRARLFGPLAATIAIAAAVGGMAGSIATAGLGAIWREHSAPAASLEAGPLRDSIARLNAELAVLKATIDKSDRSANAQLGRLGDRFDRLERGQAEPAAKLARLAEAVDRIEHGTSTPARDVTGSTAPGSPQSPATQPARPVGPPVLDGWVVRRVYNGAALIQGRFGLVEVEPGDDLPGLGRIETIRRQDGHWVVMTSRGMIVPR